jgi:predicted DNA-binding transcriptional regulator AlpA
VFAVSNVYRRRKRGLDFRPPVPPNAAEVRRERPRSDDNVAQARTVRLVEIADLLGVSKQRAHQIAEEKGFPAPLAVDARGRVWSRFEVQRWAKGWRAEKPWR